jgi:hypothetical protein
MERTALKIVQRLRNRVLTEAWLAWMQTAKEQRRIDQVGGKVVAWWQGGVLTRAFFTWLVHASEQLRLERILLKVIDRMSHRALWSSFHDWQSTVEDRNIVEKSADQFDTQPNKSHGIRDAIKLPKSTSRKSWEVWVQVTQAERQLARIAIKITLRWQHMALGAPFMTWWKHAAEQRRLALLGQKVALRFINRALTAAWDRWRDATKQQIRMERTALKIVQRLRNRVLTEAWLAWMQTAKEQSRIDQVGSKVVAWWQGGVQTRAFATWREGADRERQLARIATKITLRWQHMALAEPFGAWQAHAQEQCRLVFIATKIVLRLINRALAAAWDRWRDATKQQIRMERTALKIVQRLRNRVLTEAWLAWMQTAKEQRRIDQVGSKVVAWWQGGVLTCAFFTWQERASKQKQSDLFAHRIIMRMAHRALWSSFEAWVAHIEDKSKIENIKLKSVIQTLEEKLKRLTKQFSGPGDITCKLEESVSEFRALQRFVHGFTSKLREEISTVTPALDALVPLSSIDKKDREFRSLSLECRRLKQLVKDMVPKERLDDANQIKTLNRSQSHERSAVQYDKAARTEHQRCSAELDELKQEFQRQQALVVESKSKLQAAEEMIADLRFDLDVLQKRMLDMVPKRNLDCCLNDLLKAKSVMVSLRMQASTHLESIQTLAQDMNHLDHDDEESGNSINNSGGLGIERARAISFAVPAAGLAIGQAGRLAPFMMQVLEILTFKIYKKCCLSNKLVAKC